MAGGPKINVTYLTSDVDGTSLVIQWVRLYASTAGGMGLIPGWGTKIPHAVALPKGKNKQAKNPNKHKTIDLNII